MMHYSRCLHAFVASVVLVCFGVSTARAESAVLAASGLPEAPESCRGACKTVLGRLNAADATELLGLPAIIVSTLTHVARHAGPPTHQPVADAFQKLQTDDFDGAFRNVSAGEHICTTYYVGFLGKTSQYVGKHRCKVTRNGDSLRLHRLTGDGFNGDIAPYAGKTAAVVGRKYLVEHRRKEYDKKNPVNEENTNFGNYVGLVFSDKGMLYIIGANRRGYLDSNPYYFELIIFER